ncbi:MAG: endonuclease [Candidatus Hydrogenedentes bacterium]|nr:endonuclease [Candidatus Hydrogenedentota bacterium]
MSGKPLNLNVYTAILKEIFKSHYSRGMQSFEFDRDEIRSVAQALGLQVPKNLGDVVYSFRYRTALPDDIVRTARKGFEWIIEGAGKSKYVVKQVRRNRILPREDLLAIKIPDATPEIIAMYAQGDEQALLAKVRYNRLVDVFLGCVAYSLQNHLRTTVKGMGQIEVDEMYIAVDRFGAQYVIPVQAKTGNDQHSAVQTKQDIACCVDKFPHLTCRAVSAQFANDGVIAMFELTLDGDDVRVVQERHYRLVPADSVTPEDLRQYRVHSNPP